MKSKYLFKIIVYQQMMGFTCQPACILFRTAARAWSSMVHHRLEMYLSRI